MLYTLIFSTICAATTYTFNTSGDYSDTSNWDTYPGEYVENGDTLLILEDININVILDIYDGVILFESNVDEVTMSYVTFWFDSLLKIEVNYLELTIHGHLYFDGGIAEYPNLFIVSITNFGDGIHGGNIFAYGPSIEYYNIGTQGSPFFIDFDGYFINEGTILVEFGSLYLDCSLELSYGTIEGYSPFEIIQQGGSIAQSCSNCTSTTDNCTSVTVTNANIKGEWIIE